MQADERAKALAQMQWVATGVLVAMAVVFILASYFERQWPGLAYVRAFSEAGVVGGCADWFAVTALFRHPLGLPIPHTAIIPRNKDRIGQALGGFIAENFLTEALLNQKLRSLQVARWGGSWLKDPDHARDLAIRVAVVLPRLADAAPEGLLAGITGPALLAGVRATRLSPLLAHVIEGLQRAGEGDVITQRALAALSSWLRANRKGAGRELAAGGANGLVGWLGRLLAPQVMDSLIRLLDEMQAPRHRLRRRLRVAAHRLVRQLRTDPQLQQQVEAIKSSLLSHPALIEQVEAAAGALEAHVLGGAGLDRRDLVQRLEHAFAAVGSWISDNARARELLDAWAGQIATGLIAPRRHQIGRFVAEVVAGWDSRGVTEKLELQVGKDLQYIRINGALVGGVVGLALFALSQTIGFGGQ